MFAQRAGEIHLEYINVIIIQVDIHMQMPSELGQTVILLDARNPARFHDLSW